MVTDRMPPNRPSSIGAVIHDIAELVELQCKLIALNSREAKQSAVTAAAMAGVALVLFAVACLFTLGAVALALYEFTDLALWSAFATVGISCLILAVVLGVLASTFIKHCSQAWDVSKRELSENLRWLKHSLIGKDATANQSGREPANGSTYRPHFERQQS